MLVALPVMLAVLVVVLVLRRRLEGTTYAGTGLGDWRKVAAGLSWPERWAISRANASGRAASPELAAHAVQRGEAMAACVEVMTARSSNLRKVWLVLGVSALALCALNISLLVAGEREWHNWLQVLTQGALAVMWLSTPAVQRRQVVKLERSVERNRALVAAQ
ncbi:hypothetical protein SAMN04489844_4003 [Nocardioides exalbidus]|uniref:Uncharacterized protein n=2 Tax=Nocardioides exalbidus TaxID=402596 RepID=A0A1H4Z2T5_9ACTN|nr:hypothetical protein SAMN04489844_4003 [Nocardioides exalbidus]